jgi:hypothetical protein
MILGLLLAVASAVGTNVAFLFKHRGAVLAPPIRVRHPLRSAADLFPPDGLRLGGWSRSSRGGCTSARCRWRRCRSCRPLSGGLVFLAVFAERYFGFRLGRRQ